MFRGVLRVGNSLVCVEASTGQSVLSQAFAPGVNITDTVALALGGVRHGSRHKTGGEDKKRQEFRYLRDYPVGPHQPLPPFKKYDGRIGEWKNYKNFVHYPEHGRYTTEKLDVTKMGGRDLPPSHGGTGRKVIGRVGGGSKQKSRWIDFRRWPKDRDQEEEGDLVERVISINYDPMRKPWIALTGYGNHMRWQIATANMKVGDLLTTTTKIPPNPVRPVEGNGYPLGALPVGADICMVQWYPDSDEIKIFNSEEFVKIVRKVGDRVIIQRQDTKHQFSLDQRCMCVAGVVSIHPLKKIKIGTPQRSRWLGNAPRSGLWNRKTGHFGRKIRALPPVEEVKEPEPPKDKTLILHCETEGVVGMPCGRKRRFDVTKW